jgi:hypothetical protein
MDDIAMEEREILDMAGFKLGEAAARLMNLASECASPSTRDRLRALADLLLQQQRALRRPAPAGDSSEVRRIVAPAAAPSTRLKRHAMG